MEAFAQRLAEAKAGPGYKVKVGLPSGSGQYPDGTPVILVGIVHEFGTADGKIPERSFLRSAMRDHVREHRKLGRDLAKAVTQGRRDPKEALALLGTKAASNVAQQIIDLAFPVLKASTIARRKKKSSNPLVDTGVLNQSITYEVIE
jgi:hypothetical protein